MEIFDTIDSHSFSDDACFLCGVTLTADSRSEEHVFPRWLQDRFGIRDKTLTLLNGTTIPYRQLVVPCCNPCNTKYLSQLENRVSGSLFARNGSPGLPSLHDLYLWVSKIFFGILYREILLPLERRNPEGDSIVDPTAMQMYRMVHFFLQSVRVPMTFHCPHSPFPASVFLFDLQEPQTPDARFDFRDDVANRNLFLRLGCKGILASFDGGAQAATVGHLFARDAQHVLHPLQFEELGAKLFYKSTLLTRVPYLLIAAREGGYEVCVIAMDDLAHPSKVEAAHLNDGHVVFRVTTPEHLIGKPYFEDWNTDQYAKYVSLFTTAPLEQVNPEPGIVMSWLSDKHNIFTPLDLKEIPWRGVR